MKKLLLLAFVVLPLGAQALQTVDYVDVGRYLGRWYQQSRNVLPFEGENCVCAQQTLGLDAALGRVLVYNSCNDGSPEGALRQISGFAINDNPGQNSRFTVDFGLPQTGQYWVIGLASDYRWAVVSDPSLRSLYILSKVPQLEPELYEQAVATAAKQVDVSKLKITPHEACNYPKAPFSLQR